MPIKQTFQGVIDDSNTISKLNIKSLTTSLNGKLRDGMKYKVKFNDNELEKEVEFDDSTISDDLRNFINIAQSKG